MYSKVEFILNTDYNPSLTDAQITALASAIYTDLYNCDISATKTLGLNDYFGNEPRTFDFSLDYDTWIEDNIINEANDISREFSKYVVRVYDGANYVFSGVIELGYFNRNFAKNKVKLKAYDWLILINKIKGQLFGGGFKGYIFQKPYVEYESYLQIATDGYELSNFAKSLVCVSQSLYFGGFPLDNESLTHFITNSKIKPYTNIQNILFERQNVGLADWGVAYNKVNSDWEYGIEGWNINSSSKRAVYIFIFTQRRETNIDSFLIRYRRVTYNGINIISQNDQTFEGEYGSAYNITVINQVNDYFRIDTNRTEQILDASGLVLNTPFAISVTDNDTNIYTRSFTVTNDPGDENVYFDILLFCDFITNGQAVRWKVEQISISDALKVATSAGNGCFIIDKNNLDQIGFISKYLDSSTSPVVISDDDIIDDCQLSRIPKQGIDITSIQNSISPEFATTLINDLTTYYNRFFEQVNIKMSFTVSNLFNAYDLNITDKIDVLDKSQVINSVLKESDVFTKIESMNNSNSALLGKYSVDGLDYKILSDDGFALIAPNF